jgi:hypothetical protein
VTSRSAGVRRASRLSVLIVSVCVSAATELRAFDYQQELSKVTARCQAISPSEYQSGLLFNPDGYRSFYVRSQCFQDAAVEFRAENLCAQVKERRSLFGSSWGYSETRCRKLVSEAAVHDRGEIDKLKLAYSTGGMKLRDFRVERNGNGRDTDITPVFSGTYAHSYTLRFEIVPDASGARVLIHSQGYHVDATSNLSIYVRQADIKQRFPAFVLSRPYTVRATVVLEIGTGSISGHWSDAFIERTFPARERTQSIERQAVF